MRSGGCGRRTALGERPADAVTPLEIERELAKLATDHQWSNAVNRCKAFLSLADRIGVQNSQVVHNPVRAVRERRADIGRIRFLPPKKPGCGRSSARTAPNMSLSLTWR